MIRIEDIKEKDPVEIFDPNGVSIGFCKTEMQYLRLRCQIKKEKVRGYYFISNGVKYTFNELGNLEPMMLDDSNYPFKTSDEYLDYILDLTDKFE